MEKQSAKEIIERLTSDLVLEELNSTLDKPLRQLIKEEGEEILLLVASVFVHQGLIDAVNDSWNGN